MSETKPYKVLSLINHDHELYAVGKTIELNEKQAKELLDIEAITPVTTDKPKGSGDQKSPAKPKKGNKPELVDEIPEEFKAYAEMTNAQQIEYLNAQKRTKKELEALAPYSKAKAIKELNKQLKQLSEA